MSKGTTKIPPQKPSKTKQMTVKAREKLRQGRRMKNKEINPQAILDNPRLIKLFEDFPAKYDPTTIPIAAAGNK